MSDDDEVDLFKAYARTTDPETSHAAAATVPVARLEAKIYAEIKFCGGRGATCDDLVELTGLNWNSVSPRLAPLRRKRLIKAKIDENGEVVKRKGKTNRFQIVWIAWS